MGFIRRNLRDCTKPVKAAAYTTMARPTLEYASTVWDPHSSAETHKLEQVQRRAARFVHNNYMVQNLGWQPLQQRRYTLHGHTLEVVDSAKYLGVTISEDLQWSKHSLQG